MPSALLIRLHYSIYSLTVRVSLIIAFAPDRVKVGMTDKILPPAMQWQDLQVEKTHCSSSNKHWRNL